jgi:hypothetical protein
MAKAEKELIERDKTRNLPAEWLPCNRRSVERSKRSPHEVGLSRSQFASALGVSGVTQRLLNIAGRYPVVLIEKLTTSKATARAIKTSPLQLGLRDQGSPFFDDKTNNDPTQSRRHFPFFWLEAFFPAPEIGCA